MTQDESQQIVTCEERRQGSGLAAAWRRRWRRRRRQPRKTAAAVLVGLSVSKTRRYSRYAAGAHPEAAQALSLRQVSRPCCLWLLAHDRPDLRCKRCSIVAEQRAMAASGGAAAPADRSPPRRVGTLDASHWQPTAVTTCRWCVHHCNPVGMHRVAQVCNVACAQLRCFSRKRSGGGRTAGEGQ